MFQYSCFNISVKMGSSRKSYSVLEEAWLALLCVQVSKLQLMCGPRKSPLNIKTLNFVNKLENSVLLIVPTSCQRLINEFLLFQYSCVCISVKIINSGTISYALESVIISVMCGSVKVTALVWAKKFPSEYWNNRISLMSVNTRFCLWYHQLTKGSLTNFYCFNIHTFISL